MQQPRRNTKQPQKPLTKWQEDENRNPNLDTATHNDVLEKLKNLENQPSSRKSDLLADGKLTKGEHARMKALLGAAQGTNTWVFNGNQDLTENLTPKDILPKQTIVFNNCHGCTYTLNAVTIKVFVQNCSNFKLIVNGSIRTQMLEVFKSNDITLEINTLIQTLQIDVCDQISIRYQKRDHLKDIVWAGVENLRVFFEDSDDQLVTGYSIAKPHYPDVKLNFERSQFYVRYVDGQLRIERVIRLTNGFATTAREKKQYEIRQNLNAEKLAQLMGIRIGPKRPKGEKRENDMPFSNQSAMSLWNGL